MSDRPTVRILGFLFRMISTDQTTIAFVTQPKEKVSVQLLPERSD